MIINIFIKIMKLASILSRRFLSRPKNVLFTSRVLPAANLLLGTAALFSYTKNYYQQHMSLPFSVSAAQALGK